MKCASVSSVPKSRYRGKNMVKGTMFYKHIFVVSYMIGSVGRQVGNERPKYRLLMNIDHIIVWIWCCFGRSYNRQSPIFIL